MSLECNIINCLNFKVKKIEEKIKLLKIKNNLELKELENKLIEKNNLELKELENRLIEKNNIKIENLIHNIRTGLFDLLFEDNNYPFVFENSSDNTINLKIYEKIQTLSETVGEVDETNFELLQETNISNGSTFNYEFKDHFGNKKYLYQIAIDDILYDAVIDPHTSRSIGIYKVNDFESDEYNVLLKITIGKPLKILISNIV